jgi:hypothetical protein
MAWPLALALLAMGFVSAFGQSFGSVDNEKADTETIVDDAKGFTAQVDIDTSLIQMTATTYSDAKLREKRTDSFLIDNYPFGGANILDDTNAAFGYNGDWYGGSLSVNSGGLGGIKAWIGFLNNRIKISAGNNIGYSYADSQGADAGLRVYDDNTRTNNDGKNDADDETVDSSKNPDNITQDKGVLLEFDFDPVKIAIAGGGNISDLAKNIGSVMTALNSPNYGAEAVYGHSFQYGLNAGSKIGNYAKLNAAYIMQSVKDETKYEYKQQINTVVAVRPDAEVWNHLFGVYGSYYPMGNDTLGITLGYAGVFTKYLDEFYQLSTPGKTAMPAVFKNGINLTARYKTDKLTVKTDHNYSFWSDKNYKIFYLYKPDAQRMKDYGLLAKANDASDVSEVSHSFLWNGIGVTYKFTDVIEGSVYTRNLLRTDETPEYKMVIDYFSVEFKSTFRFSPNVEAYAALVYRYTGRRVSESLARLTGEFGTSAPKETTDSVNMFQIPIGLTVKLQR